nr:hypothetical protein [Tanacetum cinerariifolium]
MRRKQQDRLTRMDVDYQKRKEVTEFNKRRDERLKEAKERTAKKRLKRQKKKQKKQEKRIKLVTTKNIRRNKKLQRKIKTKTLVVTNEQNLRVSEYKLDVCLLISSRIRMLAMRANPTDIFTFVTDNSYQS